MSLYTSTSCSPNRAISLPIRDLSKYILTKKQDWSGLTSFYGYQIWGDGIDIYCIQGTASVYKLSGNTWNKITWSGVSGAPSLSAYDFWSDGTDIYHSIASIDRTTGVVDQVRNYKYDAATKTVSSTTLWSPSDITGRYVWTDGEHIYHSRNAVTEHAEVLAFGKASNNYVYNKNTKSWSTKTWNGLSSISGRYIWTDGTDIYYSFFTEQYVLDRSTQTWNFKHWNGLQNINAYFLFTDETNIYYFENNKKYRLDKETSTWIELTLPWGFNSSDFDGDDFWTDGTNVYWSHGSSQYVFTLPTFSIDGDNYTLENGQTWEQWVASEYNTNHLFEIREYEFGRVIVNKNTGKILCEQGAVVKPENVISYTTTYFSEKLTASIKLDSLQNWDTIPNGNFSIFVKTIPEDTTHLQSHNSNRIEISKT